MRATQQLSRLGVCLCLAAAIPAVGIAQRQAVGGPLTGPPVLDVPFSADATTTVVQTHADGRQIERTSSARYYRDGAGRVRVEQLINDARNPSAHQVRITIQPDPAARIVYVLDPLTQSAPIASRDIDGMAVGGGNTFGISIGGSDFLVFNRPQILRDFVGPSADPVEGEPLGTRQIAGVETEGRRFTTTVPSGQIVDERWESSELKLLIYSRLSDPRTGVLEYRLANIRRAQPPADLFVVPADYSTAPRRDDNGKIKLVFAGRARQ